MLIGFICQFDSPIRPNFLTYSAQIPDDNPQQCAWTVRWATQNGATGSYPCHRHQGAFLGAALPLGE
jgi:5-deoxy-D-glucuronate isomerase